MNRLQLKALLLSVITEVKFGQPLAANSIGIKNQFKAMVGLPSNASNMRVLSELKRVYIENQLKSEIESIEVRHKIKIA